MNLGPVSFLDCAVFCFFLAPALVWQAGLVATVLCVLQCLPFLIITLPLQFLSDHLLAAPSRRSPFVRQATLFEDLVVRCVRYAFANVPAKIGRIFFSREVALPFLRWRMLRHGYLRSPIHWREYRDRDFRGIWMIRDPTRQPDVVVFYIHGGGFAMGSSYFYLEFLLTWTSVLIGHGYRNPAIFALEYKLVPDACFPTQLQQTIQAYKHVLGVAKDPSIVTVSGDSAGGLLILSLLLAIGKGIMEEQEGRSLGGTDVRAARSLPRPAFAVLISPWVTLLSARRANTWSDYLDAEQIERYGVLYAGTKAARNDPLLSPGSCTDVRWWKAASPSKGFFITYGQEELFAADIHSLAERLRCSNVIVQNEVEAGGIHAWPVASVFLSSTRDKRVAGLRSIVERIRAAISEGKGKEAATKRACQFQPPRLPANGRATILPSNGGSARRQRSKVGDTARGERAGAGLARGDIAKDI
ncbi:alpha/beta-hydrolase [Thozetella sp. PMI_491]|nr:alpha/beta-hydrolase [Thozetella sp. PMI_491]